MAQILKPNRLDNRGGSRLNSGRKKSTIVKKSVSFSLTEVEEIKMRNFLSEIRNNQK